MAENTNFDIVVNKFLDKLYGNLTFEHHHNTFRWTRDGCTIVEIWKYYDRMNLCYMEFSYFLDMFSLSWKNDEDVEFLVSLISPHLKFKDGREAIPRLVAQKQIDKITEIVGYYWNDNKL